MSMLAVQEGFEGGPDSHLFYLYVNQPAPAAGDPGYSQIFACGIPSGEWVQNWPAAPPVNLVTITCQSGSDPHLFGLDSDSNLWAIGLTGSNPKWIQNWPSAAPADFKSIAAVSGDTAYLFGIDMAGSIYSCNINDGSWSKDWPGSTKYSWVPESYLAAQNPPSPHLFLYGTVPSIQGSGAMYFNGLCDVPSGSWLEGWLGPLEIDQLAAIATDAASSRPVALASLNEGEIFVSTWDGSKTWTTWTKWAQPGSSLTFIAAQGGSDAHIFGLDDNGNLWATGYPIGSWVQNWPRALPITGP